MLIGKERAIPDDLSLRPVIAKAPWWLRKMFWIRCTHRQEPTNPCETSILSDPRNRLPLPGIHRHPSDGPNLIGTREYTIRHIKSVLPWPSYYIRSLSERAGRINRQFQGQEPVAYDTPCNRDRSTSPVANEAVGVIAQRKMGSCLHTSQNADREKVCTPHPTRNLRPGVSAHKVLARAPSCQIITAPYGVL